MTAARVIVTCPGRNFVTLKIETDEGLYGLGDATLNTTVNGGPTGARYITTYFRKDFNVTGASTFSALNLGIMRDDGAVVYLNGHEVARTKIQTSIRAGRNAFHK